MFDRNYLFGHFRADLAFTFQERSIIGQFLTPVDTRIRILISQFDTSFVLVVSVQRIGVELTASGSIHVDPHIQMIPFVVGQLHVIVAAFQETDDLTGGSVVFVRGHHVHIGFRPLTVHVRMEGQVTLLHIACATPVGNANGSRILKVRATGFASVMAGYAGTVEDRLYLVFEGVGTDTAFCNGQFMRFTGRGLHSFRHRDRILVFMASHAGNHFARHTGQPATHPLHGTSFPIKRLQGDRGISRYFEDCRTVFFHRNSTQQTFDIPTGLDTVVIMVG